MCNVLLASKICKVQTYTKQKTLDELSPHFVCYVHNYFSANRQTIMGGTIDDRVLRYITEAVDPLRDNVDGMKGQIREIKALLDAKQANDSPASESPSTATSDPPIEANVPTATSEAGEAATGDPTPTPAVNAPPCTFSIFDHTLEPTFEPFPANHKYKKDAEKCPVGLLLRMSATDSQKCCDSDQTENCEKSCTRIRELDSGSYLVCQDKSYDIRDSDPEGAEEADQEEIHRLCSGIFEQVAWNGKDILCPLPTGKCSMADFKYV